MNKRRYLKIPEGCFALANKGKVLNDIIFYYQLKAINEQGFFKKGEVIKTLQSHLHLSQASIFRKIRRLCELCYMRQIDNGYQLISFDKLFRLLGYKIIDNRLQCKLFKIQLSDVRCLKEKVILQEYVLNKQRQYARALETLLQDDRFSDTEKTDAKQIPLSMLPEFFQKLMMKYSHTYLKNCNDDKAVSQYEHLVGVNETPVHSNIDCNLTLKSFARLLGYKTGVTGYRLQQSCVKHRLIEVNNRKFYYSSFQSSEQLRQLGYSFFVEKGTIYKQLPNELILL